MSTQCRVCQTGSPWKLQKQLTNHSKGPFTSQPRNIPFSTKLVLLESAQQVFRRVLHSCPTFVFPGRQLLTAGQHLVLRRHHNLFKAQPLPLLPT
ncbi:hypothetical protein RRG08_056819 [Elysia crispata]|uniref:Uncharacterized protein n=1 Tax=Elysia crispata TaxID=231223 RepID=A0AAE1AC42_9GAST|nr:hypothetical protein RRG08_056819 [Elysia crispata]